MWTIQLCIHSGQCPVQGLVQWVPVHAMEPAGCFFTPPALGSCVPMVFLPVSVQWEGIPAHNPTSAGWTGLLLTAPRDWLAFFSSQVLCWVKQSLPQTPGGHRLSLLGSIQFRNTQQSPLPSQPQTGCWRYRMRVVYDLERLEMHQGTGS